MGRRDTEALHASAQESIGFCPDLKAQSFRFDQQSSPAGRTTGVRINFLFCVVNGRYHDSARKCTLTLRYRRCLINMSEKLGSIQPDPVLGSRLCSTF